MDLQERAKMLNGYSYKKFLNGFSTEYVKEFIIKRFVTYVKKYNLQSAVLGISGGIDSTLCAYLIHEAKKQLPKDFKLIGRSYPIKNTQAENTAAKLVGEAFCDDFEVVSLYDEFQSLLEGTNREQESFLKETERNRLIREGNIQARLRMIHLYNLSQASRGIVIDTDNLTEHYLGFFTLHGDVGDLNPIGFLWKEEIFHCVRSYIDRIKQRIDDVEHPEKYGSATFTTSMSPENKFEILKELHGSLKALEESAKLIPTDGLGITSSDLEQIGAQSYADVDDILFTFTDYVNREDKEVTWDKLMWSLCRKYTVEVVMAVFYRWQGSMYKRGEHPFRFHRDEFVAFKANPLSSVNVPPYEDYV